MSIGRHGIRHAVGGMTIRHIRDIEKRRQMLGLDQLGEIENQFQLPVSGTATDIIAWGTTEVSFDVMFVMAPEQRDSALTMPHMTYGAYIDMVDSGAGDDLTVGVEIHVNVRSWLIDSDTGAVAGAKLAVGVRGDGTYSGVLHIAFQGFGAPLEDNPDLDVGT